MESFASVPRYLRATGRAFTLAPTGDMLQCAYEDEQLSARVAMRALSSRAGSEWLALGVPICAAERVRPRAALVANAELPIGALVLRDDVLVLRQTVPLQGLVPAQLELTLRALVRTTALLARALLATAAEPDRELPFRYLFK